MANTRQPNLLFLFFALMFAAYVIQGSKAEAVLPKIEKMLFHSSQTSQKETHLQGSSQGWMNRNSRRLMIGSTAPTCTYNECRGCKYKCRAEQVPVEGNDPMNSAYHYKCVCHSKLKRVGMWGNIKV